MRSVDHQSEQPSTSAMRPDSAVASTGIAISSSRVCRQALFGDGHHIRFCSGARIPETAAIGWKDRLLKGCHVRRGPGF